jgi:large subunit ribosomal protein L3
MMKKAILARKVGMTQIFDEAGRAIPVTVMEAGPCTVIGKKTEAKDGYQALKVGFYEVRERKINKPQKGQFARADVSPMRYIRELCFEPDEAYNVGQQIKADIFEAGEYVDVSGVSKGKGFAGSIKRHGQHRGPMTHGSRYHRGPGSLGSVDGARVFKGRNLPGRMGGDNVTVQKLEVVRVDGEKNLLLVKGAVPGQRGSLLMVKNSVKVS